MNIQTSTLRRPQYSALSIARTLWKRRVVLISTWIVITLLATLIVYRLPAVYSAETVILVEAKGIPENYVPSTVKAELTDRLERLKQEVLSYDHLRRMIEQFGLYQKEWNVLHSQQIIKKMRDDITMNLESGWSSGRPSTFRIAYRGPDPVVTAKVANQIGRFFIDENLRERETQATLTSDFLSSRLAEAKNKMEEQEENLKKYKLQFNGELPEQQSALLALLGQSKAQLLGVQEALNRAEQNKTIVENTLNLAKDSEALTRRLAEQLAASAARNDSPSQFAGEAAPKVESQRLKSELDRLRLRYSDQHPDVRRVLTALNKVRGLEQTRAREESKVASSSQTQNALSPAANANDHNRLPIAPELAQTQMGQRERVEGLKTQYSIGLKEIEKLAAERRRLLREIASLESRMQKLPIREQELAALMRDYEISKANYQSLLDKKLSAELAAQMERHEKAETFIMLDPARVQEVPVKPRRRLLSAVGCFLGLLLGISAALGLELKENVFLGEWELPQGTVVLGRVPRIESAVG